MTETSSERTEPVWDILKLSPARFADNRVLGTVGGKVYWYLRSAGRKFGSMCELLAQPYDPRHPNRGPLKIRNYSTGTFHDLNTALRPFGFCLGQFQAHSGRFGAPDFDLDEVCETIRNDYKSPGNEADHNSGPPVFHDKHTGVSASFNVETGRLTVRLTFPEGLRDIAAVRVRYASSVLTESNPAIRSAIAAAPEGARIDIPAPDAVLA